MREFRNVYNETINPTAKQKECIDYVGDRPLFVKGAAGAGKSMVILCKALKYIDQYEDKKNRVLILTFNKSLVHATKQILKLNGDTNNDIMVSTVNKYMFDICNELGLRRYRICDEDMQKKYIIDALRMHKKHFGQHRLQSKSVDFWLDEIEWMKDMNVTINDGEYYMSLSRTGRGGDTRMSKEDREVAFEIFYCYKAVLAWNKKADWSDCPLYVVRHPEEIADKFKYDHVLIDEAQDLSLAQMLAAMQLFKKDMLVALDINQRLYNKRWTTKMLGIRATTKKLTVSMRTTLQIDNFAESIRSINDDVISEDSDDDFSIRVEPANIGPLPEVIAFNNDAEEKRYVIDKVRTWLDESDKVSIGILAATNKQVDLFASWMSDAGIPKEIIRKDSEFDISKPGVKIVTTHSVKGFEFLRVIIPEFIQGYYPFRYRSENEDEEAFLVRERNRAYVAMTRPRKILVVTFVKARASQFFYDLNKKCYVFKDFTTSAF